MEFRKNLCSNIPDFDRESYPVFEHINDMCAATLCDERSPKISCLNRNCADCGMSKLTKFYQFVGGVGSYKFKIQKHACFVSTYLNRNCIFRIIYKTIYH
jgi:hypothetical protein